MTKFSFHPEFINTTALSCKNRENLFIYGYDPLIGCFGVLFMEKYVKPFSMRHNIQSLEYYKPPYM